jgi:hypothetical protein
LNTWSSLAVEAEEVLLNKALEAAQAATALRLLGKIPEVERPQKRHLLLLSQLLTPLR